MNHRLVALDTSRPTHRTDRAARARAIVDEFARRFPQTLPTPDPEAIPSAGRHVRCSAETTGQVYVAGETYVRDARARITAKSTGMPTGWSVRLSLVDVVVVKVSPTNPGSRADPAVLRAHRQMADPSIAVALAAPLRNIFSRRPIHSDQHSLFSSDGLVFVREASVVMPLSDDPADDISLQRSLVAAAQASLTLAKGSSVRPVPVAAESRRGHLRIIQ